MVVMQGWELAGHGACMCLVMLDMGHVYVW